MAGKAHTIYIANEAEWAASKAAAKAAKMSHSKWLGLAIHRALGLPVDRPGVTTTVDRHGIKHTWID